MASAEAELILRLNDQTQKGFESILAHLKELQAESKQTEESTKGLAGAFKDFSAGLGMGAGMAVAQKALQALGTAVLALPNAIAQSVGKVVELGGKLTDLSAKTGISAEGLQKLQFAGSQVGVGLDAITGAVSKMQVALVDAPEKFNRLGLSAEALRSMKPEDQLAAIADKIGQIADPAQRAAAAVEIFGKAGAQLLPLLTSNMREAHEEAERLGLVLSDEVVGAADDLGDSIDALGLVWEGLKNNIVAVVVTSEPLHRLFSGIIDLLGNMSKQAADNRDALRSFVDSAVLLVADGLVLLAKGVSVASDAWTTLTIVWQRAVAAAQNLWTVISLTDQVVKGQISASDALAKATIAVSQSDQQLAAAEKEAKAAGDARYEGIERIVKGTEELRKYTAAGIGITHQATGAVKDHTGALGENEKQLREREKAAKEALKAEQQAQKEFADAILRSFKEQEAAQKRAVQVAEWAADERRKAILERNAAENQAAAEEERILEENFQAARALAEQFVALGEDIGGVTGAFLQMGGAGVVILQNLDRQAETTAQKLAAAGNALNAAVSAYQSGSALGGALGGAAAGSAFGPIGTAVGALAGGLLGLFGKAAKARKELEKMRGEVLQQFGGMENLRKAAESVGVSIDRAFSTKSPAEAKRIFDELNKKLEEKQKRLDGIKTAIGGLELMTRGFAASMERAGAATDQSQAAFGRLGNFAVATFAGLVKETGDLIGALNEMGPSLDTMNQMMADFGLQASGAFSRLLQLRDIVVQNEDVANSISGLAQLMKGLGEAGLITKELLLDMGAQARANFDELIARGVDAEAAMSLMQPTLQELWEQHKRLGVQYDENTQALIDQAEQQGLVGEAFLSTNEQMLEVLKILVETLGGELPGALRRMGDAAETEFNRMGNAANRAGDAAAAIPHGGPVEGSFATGIREVPRTMVARLHAGEEVVPASDRAARRSAGARGGAQVIVLQAAPVFLDGRKVGQSMQRRIETGDITPSQMLRRAR